MSENTMNKTDITEVEPVPFEWFKPKDFDGYYRGLQASPFGDLRWHLNTDGYLWIKPVDDENGGRIIINRIEYQMSAEWKNEQIIYRLFLRPYSPLHGSRDVTPNARKKITAFLESLARQIMADNALKIAFDEKVEEEWIAKLLKRRDKIEAQIAGLQTALASINEELLADETCYNCGDVIVERECSPAQWKYKICQLCDEAGE